MNELPSGPPDKAGRRPIAVWVLTIWNGFYAGLVPAGLALYLSMGQRGVWVDLPPIGTTLSVALGLLIAATAAGAWWGSSLSRWAMLVLTTLHYATLAVANVRLMGEDGSSASGGWGYAARALLMILVNWYFMWHRAKDFYSSV